MPGSYYLMSFLSLAMVAVVAAVEGSAATPATTPAAAADGDGALPTLPSVCIIMPTNSRPEFVEHALSMISRQDYPLELVTEVVIVDDSPGEFQFPTGRLATTRMTTAAAHRAMTNLGPELRSRFFCPPRLLLPGIHEGTAALFVCLVGRHQALSVAVVDLFAPPTPLRGASAAEVTNASVLHDVDAAGIGGDNIIIESVENVLEDPSNDSAEGFHVERFPEEQVLVGELVGGELPRVVLHILRHDAPLPLEAGRSVAGIRVLAYLFAHKLEDERVAVPVHRRELALLRLSWVVAHAHDVRRFDPVVTELIEEHEDERRRIRLGACHPSPRARAHEIG